MLGVNLQHGAGLQVAQEYPTVNLGLNNIVVHVIAEVGVGLEQRGLQIGIHGVDMVPNR